MEKLKCQADNVKSGTSDKNSQGRDTSADKKKHSTTPEKRPCNLLACMATLGKRSKVTLIGSDSGNPTDYQSAS